MQEQKCIIESNEYETQVLSELNMLKFELLNYAVKHTCLYEKLL